MVVVIGKQDPTVDHGSPNPERPVPYTSAFLAPEARLAPERPDPCCFAGKNFARFPDNFRALQVVLKLLRLLGQAPFKYDELHGLYSFLWTSLPTMLTLLASTLASFGMFIYLTHIGLKKFIIFPPGCVQYSTLLFLFLFPKFSVTF